MKSSWRDIDAAIIVEPGDKARLKQRDTAGDAIGPERAEAEEQLKTHAKAIDRLQDRLWAEGKRALLVVLQGMDTSGKSGTVRAVFNACGPIGVHVTSFGKPSEFELAHDYLWRVHNAVPRRGWIGVFDRSHYEDVLVVKVRELASAKAVERRYEQINAFEKHLDENGVTILKFMLNVSRDEQRERLQARLDEPDKRWKFNPADLDDRALWNEYEAAYETMLNRCSTPHAPWRIVPADRKWRRNFLVASIVRGTLEDMKLAYPKPDWDAREFKVE